MNVAPQKALTEPEPEKALQSHYEQLKFMLNTPTLPDFAFLDETPNFSKFGSASFLTLPSLFPFPFSRKFQFESGESTAEVARGALWV